MCGADGAAGLGELTPNCRREPLDEPFGVLPTPTTHQAACESDGGRRRRAEDDILAARRATRTPLELRAPHRVHHPGSSMRCPATPRRRALPHAGQSRSVACALTNAAIRAMR
jgi:hypothetical protein